MIPVDGEVVGGQATVDQAAITGEAMPVDAGPGTQVYAATHRDAGQPARAHHEGGPGHDLWPGRSSWSKEAEANRADVQRFADKFYGLLPAHRRRRRRCSPS